MKVLSPISLIFALIFNTAIAYSQCDTYLQKGDALFAQKNYTEAKRQYLNYKECKPNEYSIDAKIAECDNLLKVDESPMIYVKGGTFTMGCTKEQGEYCSDNEKPAHTVTVSDFSIGKYPVTVGQFRSFVEATGYKTDAEKGSGARVFVGSSWENKKDANWNKPYFSQFDDFPVTCVSWNDANEYCKWLNQQTSKNYRLPTEAEWEYAARGGNESRGYRCSGSHNPDNVAWYGGNSGMQTNRVGTKYANELGIYDMSGNVWEWCSDWYGEYNSNAQMDPKGPNSGKGHVLRGGDWYMGNKVCRVSCRFFGDNDNSYSFRGFRIVLVP